MKNELKIAYVGEDLRRELWVENINVGKHNKMLNKSNLVLFSLYSLFKT